MVSLEPITEELQLTYNLEWKEQLEKSGYLRDICETYGIGIPAGKTMLSGCITFTVRDERATKVAYYGYRMKDMKPVFHKSFNPELYLYNYHNIDITKPVYLTTSLHFWLTYRLRCDENAIAVFDLPYLSARQLNPIAKCTRDSISRSERTDGSDNQTGQ